METKLTHSYHINYSIIYHLPNHNNISWWLSLEYINKFLILQCYYICLCIFVCVHTHRDTKYQWKSAKAWKSSNWALIRIIKSLPKFFCGCPPWVASKTYGFIFWVSGRVIDLRSPCHASLSLKFYALYAGGYLSYLWFFSLKKKSTDYFPKNQHISLLITFN